MADNYKLPGSSYDELIKIIIAYSTGKVGVPLSLDSLAQTTGMDKTIISRNNGFLVQLALISEGNKKSPTQEGYDLGRAYSLKQNEQVVKIWRNIILNDEFLSRMISAIKIRNGMEKASFINHILYSSGCSSNNNTKAGASAVIEILKVAMLVQEADGKIIAAEEDSIQNDTSIEITDERSKNQLMPSLSLSQSQMKPSYTNNVVININITATVEELDQLTEKLHSLLKNI